MLRDIFVISLSASPVILIFLLFSSPLRRRMGGGKMKLLWLILALRLLIPFRLEVTLPEKPLADAERLVDYAASSDIVNKPLAAYPTPTPINNGKGISVMDLLPLAYISAASLFFLWHIFSYLFFCLRIRSHLTEAADFFGVKVFVCSRIASPMSLGFVKPKILLPKADFTEKELDFLLRHEYSHICLYDAWYKLLLLLCRSLHVFNPLVHLMCAAANADVEFACDERVTKDSDESFRREYSKTVLNLVPKGEAK